MRINLVELLSIGRERKFYLEDSGGMISTFYVCQGVEMGEGRLVHIEWDK